jgi:hypothetical protein
MTTDSPNLVNLGRENAYLRTRVAQLQSDVTDLAAEAHRLREELERRYAVRQPSPPNPLGSGQ